MKKIYFDTNIFIYNADKSSIYYNDTKTLIKYCQKNDISVVTSSETIQEIIYYCQRINQLQIGLRMSKLVIKSVEQLFPVTQNTIELYLQLVTKYPKIPSRDLIHVATSNLNGNLNIITYDKHLLNMGSIKAQKPDQFINN